MPGIPTRSRTTVLRRATMALACAAAVGPGVAAAAAQAPAGPDITFGPSTPAMQTAVGIAVAHWGGTPCDGQLAIAWSPLPEGYNAQSTWAATGDAYADPAHNTNCSIPFNPGATYTWPKFCTVVVHEYGHLMGHEHSSN